MNRSLSFPAMMFVTVLILGCGTDDNQNEILIGEFSSLTGTTATFGQSTHHGLELAVEEANSAGGALGKKIKLLVEDDQSKPEEAAAVVTKLITRDNVKAIVGEVASSRSLAAAPICQRFQIPMVSPSSTNPEVTKKGDFIFRVCYIDPFQGEMIAKFVYRSLGLKKAAVLKDVKNDYSVGLAQFFTETFTALGRVVVAEQAYSEGDSDFKAQLTALNAAEPEVVVVPGYYIEGALIVKQARGLNMTMPFVGGDGWDSSKLLEVGGQAMNNTYFTTHYSSDDTAAAVQHFVAKYHSRYGERPDAMAALGYDAGLILVDAIRRAGSTQGPAIRDALATTKDFLGVTGDITINEKRNALKPIVILQVADGKLVYKETMRP